MPTGKTVLKNRSNLVASYAMALHAAAGDQHHVVSPLGAWLLLALTAPLASGNDRQRLESFLGCDAEMARGIADEMLENPHPALALAFAAWHRGDIGAGLDAWRSSLPPCATAGPMPTQAEADAWAREQTKGQVESMPVRIGGDSRLLLATAVATEAPWYAPFDLLPASELGGLWGERVNRVMRRRSEGDLEAVANTEAAGLVGVSREFGWDGLYVISVIAAPEVEPARVIAAAYEVAACFAELPSPAVMVRASDLPVTGHAWMVRERVIEKFRGPSEVVEYEVTIPAWTAETVLDDLIATPCTGFAEIARTILEKIPPSPRGDVAEATQLARARFDTNGFSAAAVTAVGCKALSRKPSPSRAVIRTVEVRFDRPFAVVAATRDVYRENPLFHGMPVFGVWVTDPMEPSEPEHDSGEWLARRENRRRRA